MDEGALTCFVEIPKGSRNKYEYDAEAKVIKLDRFLFSSMVYPTDYGFIPDTLAQDGDALDAMVCVSEPTFPGCVIPVKPIALFKMEDDKGIDDKILCVPLEDPGWNTLEVLDDLPRRCRTRSRTSSRSTRTSSRDREGGRLVPARGRARGDRRGARAIPLGS